MLAWPDIGDVNNEDVECLLLLLRRDGKDRYGQVE